MCVCVDFETLVSECSPPLLWIVKLVQDVTDAYNRSTLPVGGTGRIQAGSAQAAFGVVSLRGLLGTSLHLDTCCTAQHSMFPFRLLPSVLAGPLSCNPSLSLSLSPWTKVCVCCWVGASLGPVQSSPSHFHRLDDAAHRLSVSLSLSLSSFMMLTVDCCYCCCYCCCWKTQTVVQFPLDWADETGSAHHTHYSRWCFFLVGHCYCCYIGGGAGKSGGSHCVVIPYYCYHRLSSESGQVFFVRTVVFVVTQMHEHRILTLHSSPLDSLLSPLFHTVGIQQP